MPPRRLLGFRLAIHPAPAADDALDVLGGAGPANGEESFFRLDRRNTRQRPDLGVRQLTACERLRQPRQRAERAGHSDALARRAPIEPDAPRQPLGAREEARIPAIARVELDEVEQARGGGVEMGGQLGDLIAETLELGGGGNGRLGHGRESDVIQHGVHRRLSSFFCADFTPRFSGAPDAATMADHTIILIFWTGASRRTP